MARSVAAWSEVLLLGLLAVGCGGDSTEDGDEGAARGAGGSIAVSGGTGGHAGGAVATSGGSASGPAEEGGEPGSGGVTASGGEAAAPATGGASPSGGVSGSGGVVAGSGGTSGSGGTAGSGGIPGSGGASGDSGTSGGTSGSGGVAGSGGTSGSAGTAGSGGTAGTGGMGGSGGISQNGGAAGAGGGAAGAAGAPPIGEGFECAEPEDCALDRAACGCVASPVAIATTELPLECEHDECSDLGVSEADVTCLRGRCSLGIDCDFTDVICEAMPPDCAEGMTPSIEGDCWGPCVPLETCAPSAGIWAGDDRGLFAGVWLIGWEGGLLHFSALRLPPEADGGFEGEVELLADPGLDNNVPYFDCSGVGTFTVGANSANFTIDPPPDCDGTMERRLFMFSGFVDAGGRWGSTLMATVEATPGDAVVAYWFPPETCDATMSHCTFGGP